jgi:hypothetical protein
MTTFQQALHIFRKDARHLRLEISGVFLLLFFLIATGVQTWEGLQRRGGPSFGSEGPLSVLLAVAWSLLIARAIQTEALPGDRHFWLTRPYSRASLVLSKALFIGAFINLPFMLAQATIVSLDGLPLFSNIGGLLWNQVLISVLLLLPVAAIAALTRNLAQFLPAVVLTAALLAGPVSERRSPGDLEWIRSSLGLSVAAAIAAVVLWRQYRLRRSGNTALLAVGATVVGLILYLSFPRSVAFAIQSRLIGAADGQFALRLAEAGPRKVETKTVNRYQQLLALPIAVAGAHPEDLHIKSSDIVFKTLSGITRRPSARVDIVERKLILKTSVDRNFFDAAKNSPVTLRAEFYLTQFGNARSAEVSLDGTPVYISGPGQCGVVASYDQRMFVCRSAFQGPKPFLSERVAREHDENVYSPFPARLRIYPVVARTYQLVSGAADELAPAVPERPAILLVRAPVAYFRYTMESPNVRLGDFAITEPNE